MNKFKRDDKVEVNGNKEGIIQDYYIEPKGFIQGMVNVRLWSGFRHVGDVCVAEDCIKLNDTK